MLRNLSDFNFDFSRSLKVKCDYATGLSIDYEFLFICDSNYMSISHRSISSVSQKEGATKKKKLIPFLRSYVNSQRETHTRALQ